MKYTKELNNFEKALDLNDRQVKEIKRLIERAYDQHWHPDGPNIDQINAFVATNIHTPEEAFYAAQVIMSDVFGMMMAKNIAKS